MLFSLHNSELLFLFILLLWELG